MLVAAVSYLGLGAASALHPLLDYEAAGIRAPRRVLTANDTDSCNYKVEPPCR